MPLSPPTMSPPLSVFIHSRSVLHTLVVLVGTRHFPLHLCRWSVSHCFQNVISFEAVLQSSEVIQWRRNDGRLHIQSKPPCVTALGCVACVLFYSSLWAVCMCALSCHSWANLFTLSRLAQPEVVLLVYWRTSFHIHMPRVGASLSDGVIWLGKEAPYFPSSSIPAFFFSSNLQYYWRALRTRWVQCRPPRFLSPLRLSFALNRNPSHWRFILLIGSRCMDVTHFNPGRDAICKIMSHQARVRRQTVAFEILIVVVESFCFRLAASYSDLELMYRSLLLSDFILLNYLRCSISVLAVVSSFESPPYFTKANNLP